MSHQYHHHQQPHQHQPGVSSGAPNTAAVGGFASPTAASLDKAVVFRVMRLFKPAFYSSQATPLIATGSDLSCLMSNYSVVSDNSMSPFLLLPENFGDAYLGETFSAYVATINAIQDPIYNIHLTLRLTTQNTNRDLEDSRQDPNQRANVALASNEGIDVVFHHKLTEVGPHTLKATATFTLKNGVLGQFPGAEIVHSVKKFYRFQVFAPLNIASTCSEVGNKIFVQCLVTNSSRSNPNLPSLYLEQVNFRTTIKDAIVTRVGSDHCGQIPVSASKNESFDLGDVSDVVELDSFQLLGSNESVAYSYIIQLPPSTQLLSLRSVGWLEVYWSSG